MSYEYLLPQFIVYALTLFTVLLAMCKSFYFIKSSLSHLLLSIQAQLLLKQSKIKLNSNGLTRRKSISLSQAWQPEHRDPQADMRAPWNRDPGSSTVWLCHLQLVASISF